MLEPRPVAAPYSIDPAAAGDAERIAPPILLQYWQVVLRWRWVILGILAASLLAGLIATLMMTPQYTSTTRIEISREEKNITKVEGVDSSDARGDLEFYQTQEQLLRARSLASRVARSMRLATNEDFFEAHNESSSSQSVFASNKASDRREREDRAVDLLLNNIAIAPIRGSSLIDIKYTSAAPALSAEIANVWAQQFIGSGIDRKFSSTADARRFLETQLSQLRERLENAEREAANYASEKNIVPLAKTQDAQGRTQSERTLAQINLEALNEALTKATAERIAAESSARQSAATAGSVQLENTAITSLRQKRAEVAAEYAKLMVQFEPQYPAARALAQQLSSLDSNIAREEARTAGSHASSRNAEYRQALERERVLAARVGGLRAELDSQQRDSIQFNIYQREADTTRQLYDSLLQRYKEIGVTGVGANNIAIIDAAEISDKPSSPNLPLNLLLSLLGGLGLALVATFALDQIDEGLREPGQVNRMLQIPLLGTIPDVGEQDALAALSDAKSDISEAYLSVRSNLAFSTDHGVPRSLMVTSTRAAEGKSTTSLALAIMLGRTGKRVLLIDGDMRSPSMHSFVGMANANGLSNYLAGDNNWQAMVHDTKLKNLDAMFAGPTPPSAAELLSSDRLSQLVTQLQDQYDHVVVDSAPILGLADAPLLARSVEGAVFVIEAEGVAIRGVKAALGRLQAVHANVLGAVLTKMQLKKAGYGYGYGYGYGHGKGSDERSDD